jgi:hypothetical protein
MCKRWDSQIYSVGKPPTRRYLFEPTVWSAIGLGSTTLATLDGGLISGNAGSNETPSSATEESTQRSLTATITATALLHSHTTDATPRAAGLLCVRPITNSGARYYNPFSAVIILYVSNSEVLAVLIRRCTRGRSRQSSVVVSCASATTTTHILVTPTWSETPTRWKEKAAQMPTSLE